jgi:hypothetical protein
MSARGCIINGIVHCHNAEVRSSHISSTNKQLELGRCSKDVPSSKLPSIWRNWPNTGRSSLRGLMTSSGAGELFEWVRSEGALHTLINGRAAS